MYYPDEVIEDVRQSNDIVDVVSEYVRLKKQGSNFFGLCPFHKEKTPSFSVSPSKQIYHCFGCAKGGNVISFIMEIENFDFPEAIKYLAQRVGITLPESSDSKEAKKNMLRKKVLSINLAAARFYRDILFSAKGKEGAGYLKKRGISEKTAKKFGLGYSMGSWSSLYDYLKEKGYDDKEIERSGLVLKNKNNKYYDRFRGRIMFPIFDAGGTVIGFGGRVLTGEVPKYMNSPETIVYNKRKNLYSLNFARKTKSRSIVIVEGYMDVISLFQSGISNVAASLGTALTVSQGRLLKKYADEVIIAYDADLAGRKAALRGIDILSQAGLDVKIFEVPKGKDPDEYVRENGPERLKMNLKNSIGAVDYKIKIFIGKLDMASTEGKIKFLTKTSEVLSKLDSRMEIEMYAKKLGNEYGISEHAILSEVEKFAAKENITYKLSGNIKNKRSEDKNKEINNDRSRTLENQLMLLVYLCIDNSIFNIVMDKIKIEDFMKGSIRKTAEKIFEMLLTKKSVETGKLINMVEPEFSSKISRYAILGADCDNIEKAVRMNIEEIQREKAFERKKEILKILDSSDKLDGQEEKKLKEELKKLMILIKK